MPVTSSPSSPSSPSYIGLAVDKNSVQLKFTIEQSDQPPWTSARPHRLTLTITNTGTVKLKNVTMDPMELRKLGDAQAFIDIVNTVPIVWSSVPPGKTVAPDEQQPGGRMELYVKVRDNAPPLKTFTLDGSTTLKYDVEGDSGNVGKTDEISVNP
jgi:hypothetical protein